MYRLILFVRLLAQTFSLRRGDLRFPSVRRIGAVLAFGPLFALLFVLNRSCLLLDELFFPAYRKTACARPVFIIGLPRSATTFLFQTLAADTRHFHCFKLWELVLAPSILQKYFFLGLRALDRRLGDPLYRFSGWLDRRMFGEFRGIHDMGWTKPEEDEVLFLYRFSSAYLHFFYPGAPAMTPLLHFDNMLPRRVKKAEMRFYHRCLQRHQYVFDRAGRRRFLSKNPTFVPKMGAIAEHFADARFIYPLRSPWQVIPSTLSLNTRIYRLFCSPETTGAVAARTVQLLLDWYEHADSLLRGEAGARTYTAYYRRVTAEPQQVLEEMYRFLEIEGPAPELPGQQAGGYKSPHQYPDALPGIDTDTLRRRLERLFTPDIWGEI